MSTQKVCEDILKGIELDILEYIINIIENPKRDYWDIQDSIISFLLASEFSTSRSAAAETCLAIFTELGIYPENSDLINNSATKLLDNHITLSKFSFYEPSPYHSKKIDSESNYASEPSDKNGKIKHVKCNVNDGLETNGGAADLLIIETKSSGSMNNVSLYELFKETLIYAEESGFTGSFETFKSYIEDMIPFNILEQLYIETNVSLESLWEEKYNSESTENSDGLVEENCCEICEREMKLTMHHLIPRELHEKIEKKTNLPKILLNKTISICRMCHSTVHRIFTNAELAYQYNTVEKLLANDKLLKYAKWASGLTGHGNMSVR